jgi:MFS family permease
VDYGIRERGADDSAVQATPILLLNRSLLNPELGWRLGFFIGAVLSLIILSLRSWIPESPRWLVIHGREAEAEAIAGEIEAGFRAHGTRLEDGSKLKPMRIRPRTHTPLAEVFGTIFVTYRTRALVGLTLTASQAFFYNAIFFTYALVLTKFYGVPAQAEGWYILPFTLANVLGPIALGHLFDSIGRKPMIAATRAISGVLLALSGWLFAIGALSATQQTIAWAAIFFFASPAAGSAYLTVSEVFPVEIRALAIAVFYSLGTAIGGAGAPYLLGSLIETGSRMSVFAGYLLGAGLTIFAAIVELAWGVAAERKPLESVDQPLSHTDE